MDDKTTRILNDLITSIATLNTVKSIGISGKLRPSPLPGMGDFDIFVYCDEIPGERTRHNKLTSCTGIEDIRNLGSSDTWDCTDYCTIMNIDTFVIFLKHWM